MEWHALRDVGNGKKATTLLRGTYGVTGTPGNADWVVTHAFDNQPVDPKPVGSTLSEARRKAETRWHEEHEFNQSSCGYDEPELVGGGC